MKGKGKNCHKWAKKEGYCKKDNIFGYKMMKRDCKKSCGFCTLQEYIEGDYLEAKKFVGKQDFNGMEWGTRSFP